MDVNRRPSGGHGKQSDRSRPTVGSAGPAELTEAGRRGLERRRQRELGSSTPRFLAEEHIN